MTILIRLILSTVFICTITQIQAQKTVFFGVRYEAPDGTWELVSDSTFVIQEASELESILHDLGVYSPIPAHRVEVSIQEKEGRGVPQMIRQRKENQQAFLGVEIDYVEQEGARILEILDYPAMDAGLKAGDMIYRFDQTEILSLADLPNVIRQCEPGSSHRIHYRRNGKNRKATAILGSRKTVNYEEDVLLTPVIQVKVYISARIQEADTYITQQNTKQNRIPMEMLRCDLYPNPSAGEFTLDVELVEAAPTQILVLNPLGQVLYHEQVGEMQSYKKKFDFSQLSKGVYIIHVQREGKIESKRLVIE